MIPAGPRITLRGLATAKRVPVVELAARTGRHRNTILGWLRGATEPTISDGVLLARALDVPLDTLASAVATSRDRAARRSV